MMSALDVPGRFGLPLEITEVTIPTFGEGEEYEHLQADMLKHLFEEKWNTSLTLQADDEGYINFRGFFGNYAISTEKGCGTFALEKGKANEQAIALC